MEFSYRPLDSSADEIRVLQLQPRQLQPQPQSQAEADDIECVLMHTNMYATEESFESIIPYEALSYEWGTPSTTPHTIRINGCTVPVRENLWWALHFLRLETPRMLWIDALCINQEDIEERSSQVRRMAVVYEAATSVIAWIGREKGPSTPDALSEKEISMLLENLPDAPNRDNEYLDLDNYERITFHEGNTISDDPYVLNVSENALGEGLLGLFGRSYFTRLWIVQEIVCAKRVSIHCGPLILDWDKAIWLLVERYDKGPKHLVQATGNARFIYFQRVTHEFGTTLYGLNETIVRTLSFFGNFQCEDTRDRIFGTHAWGSPCCSKAIPVDYSKSSIDILLLALEHTFSKEHRLPRGMSLDRYWGVYDEYEVVCAYFGLMIPDEYSVRGLILGIALRLRWHCTYRLIKRWSYVGEPFLPEQG